MLNLNYNINPSSGPGNCRGEVKFNYSASFFLAGGGGGGAAGGGGSGVSEFYAGGGGGGAQALSSSINIIPNVAYQINIGASGSGGINQAGFTAGQNGQQSSFVYFNDTDTTGPITLIASGGFGAPAGGSGGTSANGFAGGAPGTIAAGTRSGGGGGGNQQNGENGDVGVAGFGGDGGNYGGGGGGAARNQSSGGSGTQYNSIGIPGTTFDIDLTGASGANGGSGFGAGNAGGNATFAGGGGGSSDSFTTSYRGGNGGQGVLKIAYKGKQKATGGTITYNSEQNTTTHTFTSGSHTFLYTYPYPWEDVVPYTVEVCPDEHNEDVRPEIYWDLTYSTIQSRFPAVPVIVSSSYATMSIDAVNSNCINVTTTNNSVFTTNAQSTVVPSLTGSNWPSTGSVTMSLSVAGITYDPLSTNQFYSASFSASSNVYNSNPSITGSIISSSFIASEFYRFYVNGSVIHRFGGEIPRNGLIQILDASNPASYPGSGSIWYDISGYNHNMSSSFGATFPSYNNNQFNFNGINNAVSTFITSSLNAFSLVTWTKIGSLAPIPTSSRSGGAYSITTGSGNFGTQFDSLTFDENREDKWEIATEQNNRDVRSSVQETVASLDEYVMISMTNAGLDGTQKLYRNSTLVATGSFGSQYTSSLNLVLVGSRYYTFPSGSTPGSYAPEGFYTGSIVSCLLYNRELSDIDILDIFNAGAFTN